jgi:hypothetical protein
VVGYDIVILQKNIFPEGGRIMHKIAGFDEFLVDKVFQRFSDWLHATVGINCFSLAKNFFALSCIFCITFIATPGMFINIILTIIIGIYCIGRFILYAVIIYVTNFIEQILLPRGSESSANPLKLILTGERIKSMIFLILFSILFFPLLHTSGTAITKIVAVAAILLTAVPALYFASCTPRPPQISKLRVWLASLTTRHELVPIPVSSK